MAGGWINEELMGSNKDTIGAIELRRRAEGKLKEAAGSSKDLSEVSPEKMASLIHELEVHQIELTMQNDELRRIQGELEKTRDKYSHLYDFAPVGYFTISEKGIIDEVNLTGAAMIEIERNALIGKPFTRFVLREDQDIFYVHRQRLMETETSQSFELRLVKKDGHAFYARLECMVIKNKGDDLRQIRAAVSDITEQKLVQEVVKRAYDELEQKVKERTVELEKTNELLLKEIERRRRDEEALRESEEQYRALFDYNPVETIIVDKTAKIKMFNFTRENSEERLPNTGDVMYKDYARKHQINMFQELMECIRSGEKKEFPDLKYKERYLHIRMSPFSGGAIITSIDLTEIKNLFEQLRQSQKMEDIGILAGGIAHDFNNILAIIFANTELAIGNITEWNPAKEYLKEIQTASLRAKDLVWHILSYSRKAITAWKPIKIGPIIEDSLKMLRASIPTDIVIRQNISCESDMIMTGPTQIGQVLMNLCTNAAHAMHNEGGILEVSLEDVELGRQNVKLGLGPGRYVKLTVSDTGHGIDPKNIDRIFDPYFTTKGLGEGTGLGLSVVQGIVKTHHGAVTVKSEPGKRTVFEVLIPLTESEAQSKDKKAEAFPTGNEKILFIDDEKSLLKSVKKRLEMLGYQVEAKDNPVDALESFRSGPDRFDLIITDMTMPKMTGDKLTRKILSIRPDMPIILCSGYSDRIDAEKAAAMGMRKYIEKPLNMSDFVVSIRQVLDEAKAKSCA